MSLQICTRCLVRASNTGSFSAFPILNLHLPNASATSFSTSAALFVLPPKKKVVSGKSQKNPERGERTTFGKKKGKKVVSEKGKRPAIGERKALRKRVVLSNTNALEVNDLEDFATRPPLDARSVGKVVGIPNHLVDQLRAVQAFKPSQGWSLFRRPAMVIRRETVEYDKLMQDSSSGKKTVRRVLVGERATGKTVMLLQVMAMAMMKGWVVINIPDGTLLLSQSSKWHHLPSPLHPNYRR